MSYSWTSHLSDTAVYGHVVNLSSATTTATAAPIKGKIIGMVGAVGANTTAAVISLKINGGSAIGTLTLGTTAFQATTVDFINGAGTTITNGSNFVNVGDSIQFACDGNGTNGVAAEMTVVIRGAG